MSDDLVRISLNIHVYNISDHNKIKYGYLLSNCRTADFKILEVKRRLMQGLMKIQLSATTMSNRFKGQNENLKPTSKSLFENLRTFIFNRLEANIFNKMSWDIQ